MYRVRCNAGCGVVRALCFMVHMTLMVSHACGGVPFASRCGIVYIYAWEVQLSQYLIHNLLCAVKDQYYRLNLAMCKINRQ